MHAIFQIFATNQTGTPPVTEWSFTQIPVIATAATVWTGAVESAPDYVALAPPPLPIGTPTGTGAQDEVFIAVKAPVDVVDLAVPDTNGFRLQRTFLVTAQVLNWFKNPSVLDALKQPALHPEARLHVTLRDAGSHIDVLNEELYDVAASAWRVNFSFANDDRTAAFILSRPVPNTFTFGTLILEFSMTGVTSKREVQVQLAPVDVLHWPVGMDAQGELRMQNINGIGANGFNGHNGDTHQRYALDLWFLDANNGRLPPPITSTTATLDDFYIYRQPILCLADGVVTAVSDPTVDTFPATGTTNRVFVRHPHAGGSRYSVYAHVRGGSATVAEGDVVIAGQKLAEVGNTGSSSEPHLHLGYYTIDPWGRYRALPVAFGQRSDGTTAPVVGVPQDGTSALPDPTAIGPDDVVTSLCLKVRTGNDMGAGTDDEVMLFLGHQGWPLGGGFARGSARTFDLDPGPALTRSAFSSIRLFKAPDNPPDFFDWLPQWFIDLFGWPWSDGGGWTLAGVELVVNGVVLFDNQNIDRRLSLSDGLDWSASID
jgi:hypothetical protein